MGLLIKDVQYQPQKLRDYQQAAVAAIRQAWDDGEPAPLAALATGAGKTTVIAQVLVESLDPLRQRALVIGHTEEIISQLSSRIANQFNGKLDSFFLTHHGAPGLGIVMAENDHHDARIIVATRQSLHPRRLNKLLQSGAFDIVVIDEAHHAFGDNSYGTIVQALRTANPALKLVGFTATPSRGDGLALESVFSKIVYQWLIPDGIARGYLVPVTRIKVTTQVDASGIRSQHGDYAQTKLVSVLETANWLDLAERAYRQYVLDTKRPTLAFFPTVEMSQTFVERLGGAVSARHLDGTTPKEERRAVLRDYADGKVALVANFGVLTEGFDAPQTSALLMARPTRSQVLYTQIVGRGLRPYPGKHDCLLVDLAVTDTKALEAGSLLGRMTRCPKCGSEHYAGLKACPICGHVVSWKQRAAAGVHVAGNLGMGGDLIANFEPLFEKSFAAWHTGSDGFYSCTLSFEDGALIIVPPLEDELYRLAYVPSDKGRPVSYLMRNEDLASLMMDADEYIRQHGAPSANKEAGWRGQAASMAQLHLLGKLNIPVPEGVSKGMASQMITHALSVRRLLQEG